MFAHLACFYSTHKPVPDGRFVNNARRKTTITDEQFDTRYETPNRFVDALCSIVQFFKYIGDEKIAFDFGVTVTYSRNLVHIVCRFLRSSVSVVASSVTSYCAL